jgi:hypothetical protein
VRTTILISMLMLMTSFAQAESMTIECKGQTEKYGEVVITMTNWTDENDMPHGRYSLLFQGVVVSGSAEQDENYTLLEGKYQVGEEISDATYFGKIKVSNSTPSKIEVFGKGTIGKDEYPINSILTCNDDNQLSGL